MHKINQHQNEAQETETKHFFLLYFRFQIESNC